MSKSKWYLEQRKRWAKLERAGWLFEKPAELFPEYVTILIKRDGVIRGVASVTKAHFNFRGIHTAMLWQCETIIKNQTTKQSKTQEK